MAFSMSPKMAEVVGEVAALDRCLAGSMIEIVELRETNDDDDCRLRELGLYEGASCELLSQGDPVVVRLLDARIAICRRCARHVSARLLGVLA